MAIKYVSPHHSEDDPGGLIHDVIAAGADFAGPAEDIILTWTLRLGEGRDPAAAAQRLLAAHGLAEGPLPQGAAGRVIEMLREAASYPEDRLRRHVRPKRDGRRRKRPAD
ncbi:MAG: hypothetical protein ACFCUQ_16005 [Kiloniellales bacterium]